MVFNSGFKGLKLHKSETVQDGECISEIKLWQSLTLSVGRVFFFWGGGAAACGR